MRVKPEQHADERERQQQRLVAGQGGAELVAEHLGEPDRAGDERQLHDEVAHQPSGRTDRFRADAGVGYVVEVRPPHAEHEDEHGDEHREVDAVEGAVGREQRDLHERLAAHDDREEAESFDEVVLVERRHRAQATEAEAERRPREEHEADDPERDAGRFGANAATTIGSATAQYWLRRTARETPGLVAAVHRARVHHRDVEREQRVGDRDQPRVRLEAVADGERVDREEQHLREHERALDRAVVAVAVGVQGGGQPDQPHRCERRVDRADAARGSGAKLMASLNVTTAATNTRS